MHEEIRVSHGAEIPAFQDPDEFLEYYAPLLKRSQFLLGAIHMDGAHGCRMRQPLLRFGGAFAGILRHPIARTCSQFTHKNKTEFYTKPDRKRLFKHDDTAEIYAACLKFLRRPELQPSQIEFLRATIQTLRNDLDLMGNATPDELARWTKYGSRMITYHHDHQPGEIIYPTSITRSLVEEFSGRPFEYEEILPVFQSYQPDIKANQVPAETRAMADICLLLFNTNEFIYVE